MGIKLFFLGFLFFLIPAVNALTEAISIENCPNLGIERCPTEKDLQGLSDQDKLRILLDILFPQQFPEYYQKIVEWNSGLVYSSEPPEGVNAQNNPYVQNAWMKIMTVTPSVYSGIDVIVPEQSNVFTGLYYDLVKPQDYNAGGQSCGTGSTNEFGDCKTNYGSPKDKSILSVYKDGILLGNSKILPFENHADSSQLSANLQIVSEMEIDHYKWQKSNSCCKKKCAGPKNKNCFCVEYYFNCKYTGKEARQFTTNLEDTFTVKNDSASYAELLNLSMNYNSPKHEFFALVKENSGLAYKIDIGQSWIKKQLKSIQLSKIYKPYDPVIVKASDQPFYDYGIGTLYKSETPYQQYNRIFFESLLPEGECSFSVNGFFSSSAKICSYSKLNARLELGIGKSLYKINESASLTVRYYNEDKLANAIVHVDHNGIPIDVQINGEGVVELIAKEGINRVIVTHDTGMGTVKSEIDFRGSNFNLGKAFDFLWPIFVIFFIVYRLAMYLRRKNEHARP